MGKQTADWLLPIRCLFWWYGELRHQWLRRDILQQVQGFLGKPEFFGGTLPVRKPKNIGLLEGKVPMFCLESTEVCLKEVRCFAFPEPTPPKKFFVFLLHFLHQSIKFPLYIGDFGWRIGCRIQVGCRMNPIPSVLFILFFALFGPQDPSFSYDSVPDTARNCSTIERFHDNSSGKHPTIPRETGCEISLNSAVGVG